MLADTFLAAVIQSFFGCIATTPPLLFSFFPSIYPSLVFPKGRKLSPTSDLVFLIPLCYFFFLITLFLLSLCILLSLLNDVFGPSLTEKVLVKFCYSFML